MDNERYLKDVLKSQTLSSDGSELAALQQHRADVEDLLRENFNECSPTIRYGGSKAKGTMIREAYDLDIISYFPNDDTEAGESLEDIYNNVRTALGNRYMVEQKPSALRIKDNSKESLGVDFHIDVVPGRYTDDSKTDVFLYRSSGDKKRLKTNLDVHLSHVKDSGVTEAIRLMKLWRIRNGISVTHFALELLVIKLLKKKQSSSLSAQLEYVWQEMRDNIDNLSIEDPANPTGNDLSDLLSPTIRSVLSHVSEITLKAIEDSSWEAVFGEVEVEENDNDKTARLKAAASSVSKPTKPWLDYDEGLV